ncbi:hypothetical protein, partial [Acinetobacter ursingii]|uniref:hypothetical protein n=1 Tax=Acinetobacter ursingii TaxID=108980 RepID=UPI001C0710C7
VKPSLDPALHYSKASYLPLICRYFFSFCIPEIGDFPMSNQNITNFRDIAKTYEHDQIINT